MTEPTGLLARHRTATIAVAPRFPVDQRHFVGSCLTEDFEQGLLREARRGDVDAVRDPAVADGPAEPS